MHATLSHENCFPYIVNFENYPPTKQKGKHLIFKCFKCSINVKMKEERIYVVLKFLAKKKCQNAHVNYG